jgi:2-dehydropantoate 2-reductase
MRFVIVGAGAVGGVLGAQLAHGGQEVVLVDPADHIDVIRERGLHLRGNYGDYLVRPATAKRIGQVTPGAGDVVCLAVKMYDTPATVAELRAVYPADTPVVVFQNTVDNEPIIARTFSRVYSVAIRMGAKFVKAGEVHQIGSNKLTLGRYPSGLDEALEAIADGLRKGGFEVHLNPDIMSVKWYKLFLNLSNSMYALFGHSSEEGPRDPGFRLLRAEMLEEALGVVRAHGLRLQHVPGEPPIEELIASLRRGDTPARPVPADPEQRAYPSMWQDIYWKRGKTEADGLNGKIAAMGRGQGIPTPINALLHQLITEVAENRDLPGKYTIRQFRELLVGQKL